MRLLYADLFRLTQFASAKVPLTRLTKMWFWHLDKQISGSGKLCAFNVSFLPKSDATSIHFLFAQTQNDIDWKDTLIQGCPNFEIAFGISAPVLQFRPGSQIL